MVFDTGGPTSLYNSALTHHANPTQNPYFFHVEFTAKSDTFSHTGPAILDTGSNVTVIPIKQLQPSMAALVTKCTTSSNISGVGGKLQVVGHLDAKLQLGDLELPDTRFLVVDQDIPCLLGQNVLTHELLTGFKVDFQSKSVTFFSKCGTPKSATYTHFGRGLCLQTECPQPQ